MPRPGSSFYFWKWSVIVTSCMHFLYVYNSGDHYFNGVDLAVLCLGAHAQERYIAIYASVLCVCLCVFLGFFNSWICNNASFYSTRRTCHACAPDST